MIDDHHYAFDAPFAQGKWFSPGQELFQFHGNVNSAVKNFTPDWHMPSRSDLAKYGNTV
jgi:hypothetical protein